MFILDNYLSFIVAADALPRSSSRSWDILDTETKCLCYLEANVYVFLNGCQISDIDWLIDWFKTISIIKLSWKSVQFDCKVQSPRNTANQHLSWTPSCVKIQIKLIFESDIYLS